MKITFIGCGNMASAIIGGLLKNGAAQKEEITAADPFEASREKAREAFGIKVSADNIDAVKDADVVVLAVKPQALDSATEGLGSVITDKQLVISIVAGQSLKRLEDLLGENKKIVRVMPNTPALVGEGISGWCVNKNTAAEDKEAVKTILSAIGEGEEVPEHLMGVVTSLSGSSPAYIYMLIEAMADAAVLDGMPRQMAYHFASQTVLGSAKMVLETGKHPGELKDMVTSPAGTTIEGVRTLEENGFRGTVIKAIHASTEKALNI